LSANKRIALITSLFPPQQSVATNRMLAFAEYLSLTNEVEVFAFHPEEKTIEWNENTLVHYSANGRLTEQLKHKQSDGVVLHTFKVGTRILLTKFMNHPFGKWQKSTLAKLKDRHTVKPFDCLISSFSPHEAHLVAIDFKKEFPDVPWIADMRDEMSTNPYLDTKTRKLLLSVEQEVGRYADALTSVSEPILSDFKASLSKIKFFEEIRNGFNHDYLRDKSQNNTNQIFTLGYFGTFYGKRKPHILMEALRQLNVEIPDFDFVFEIVGAHQNFSIPKEISDKVKLLEPLKYFAAIEKMATLDANVIIHPRSKQKGVFTGKLFDYISVQKPVLAFVDKEDVAAKLIEEFDCGYTAEFSEISENKHIIFQAYLDWKNHQIKFASDEQVQSLHRKKQVEKLNHLISKLTQ
jgi:glycosyltransferase involved in cell wall biosynthesis